MTTLCVISLHEKGFWQADIYLDGWDEGVPPDGFLTGQKGGKKETVIDKVKNAYPTIEFVDGFVVD